MTFHLTLADVDGRQVRAALLNVPDREPDALLHTGAVALARLVLAYDALFKPITFSPNERTSDA
mgnify:FL=1